MNTPFKTFATSDDVIPFLDDENKLVYPLCDNTIFVIKKCVDIDPDNYVVYDNNQATIAGLFIKQVKLFEEFYDAYKKEKLYVCVVFQRIIYEAFVKMEYLIKYGEEAQTTFRSYSYKARNQFYEEHKSSEDGYFMVRNKKYINDLMEDGFTTDDIKNSKKSFGGKNFYQLVEELEDKSLYISLYGIASDSIHSDWGDIRQLYLQKTQDGNSYEISDSFSNKLHYRYLMPVLDIINCSSICYIDWILSDNPQIHVLNVYKEMLQEFKRVSNLIMQNVKNEYRQNPSKYMYE